MRKRPKTRAPRSPADFTHLLYLAAAIRAAMPKPAPGSPRKGDPYAAVAALVHTSADDLLQLSRSHEGEAFLRWLAGLPRDLRNGILDMVNLRREQEAAP